MNRYAVNRGVAHTIKNFRRRLDERKQGCQHGPTIHKAYCTPPIVENVYVARISHGIEVPLE